MRMSQLAIPVKCKNAGMKETNLLSLSYGKIVRKDIEKAEGLAPASYEEYNIISEGDIVLRLTDLQNDQRSLRTGLAEERGIITSAYLTIRPDVDRVFPDYLHYLLYAADVAKIFYNMGSGLRQSLDWSEISHMLLPVPPPEEQRWIAGYLNERCGLINEARKAIKNEVEALRRLRKATIFKAVTKGLGDNVPMQDSGIEWIGSIPANWRMVPNYAVFSEFREVAGNRSDQYTLLSLTKQGIIERDMDGGGKFPSSFDTYQVVRPGQMVFCLFDIDETPRTVGLSAKKGMITGAYDVFDVKQSVCDPRYALYFYLIVDEGKHLRPYYRSLRKTLTSTAFRHVKMPLPLLEEQQCIAEYLDERCDAIDSFIDVRLKQLERLEDYRKSLIYAYATGKKEVPPHEQHALEG